MLPSASEYLLKTQTKNKLESSFQDSFCVLTEGKKKSYLPYVSGSPC